MISLNLRKSSQMSSCSNNRLFLDSSPCAMRSSSYSSPSPISSMTESNSPATSFLNFCVASRATLWMAVYSNLFSSSLSNTMQFWSTKLSTVTRHSGEHRNCTSRSYFHFCVRVNLRCPPSRFSWASWAPPFSFRTANPACYWFILLHHEIENALFKVAVRSCLCATDSSFLMGAGLRSSLCDDVC